MMGRSLLLHTCSVLLSCLPSRLESRTVSPDLHVFTTDAPRRYYYGHRFRDAADLEDRPAAANRYGNVPTESRWNRDVDDGYYHHRRGATAAAANHALYESPNTYEYMNSPTTGGKRGQRIGVPKTENRPPGEDDVELIVKNHGRGDWGRDGKTDDGITTDGGKATGTDSVNVTDGNRPVTKKKATSKRNGENRNEKRRNKRKRSGGKKENGVPAQDATAAAHEVHKKNEYSKKRQFYDEEHVKNGKKKKAKNGRQQSGGSSPKPKRRAKNHQLRRHPVVKPRPSAYGQILVLR